MLGAPPTILWLRRDLRLDDHPALTAALAPGGPVIPLFIRDTVTDEQGSAAQWRLGAALASFAARLEGLGSRLILRQGPALVVLRALVAETGAVAVHWTRAYDAPAIARDTEIKACLRAGGVAATGHPGFLLAEPWQISTGQGGPYRVYGPFWKALRQRDTGLPLPAPKHLPPPDRWPHSAALADWCLGAGMRRGAGVVAARASVGEGAAQARLARFLSGPLETYAHDRDFPALPATSGLSEHLSYGEISPRRIWHGGLRALHAGQGGAEKFLSELAWRDFAWHLFHHRPDMGTRNWRPEWDAFPWRGDNSDAEAWRRGRTGVAFVDAALREMIVSGRMHNRARMIAASYLTKHLLTDWRIGLAWFAEYLTDWDAASNALGWQWVAGSGPDAAPYFRIFNPDTQAQKFDPDGAYRARYLAEGQRHPPADALAYDDAIPLSWGPRGRLPATPPMTLAEGRVRALAAYARLGR